MSELERTSPIFNSLAEKLFQGAGIRLHEGKTRVEPRCECPADMQNLGPDVWSPDGVKILGTPVGCAEFVETATDARLEEEKLWAAMCWIPDLQCAWQVLVQCAGPRCHHLLRTLPPSRSAQYAQGHDEGMQRAMRSLLGGLPGDDHQQGVAAKIASLPMRMGGLGSDRRVQRALLTDMVSLAGQIGQSCVWASDLHLISLNQASGRTVGSTARLRLPTHTIGRPWY